MLVPDHWGFEATHAEQILATGQSLKKEVGLTLKGIFLEFIARARKNLYSTHFRFPRYPEPRYPNHSD